MRNDLNRIGLAALLALSTMPACGADSASVEIQANVPTQCEVQATKSVESTAPLLVITANVNRACNATHTLSVTFAPATLSAPETLDITFDGAPPTSIGSGLVTFANLTPTNSAELLEFSYGGTQAERDQIAATIAIGVAAP